MKKRPRIRDGFLLIESLFALTFLLLLILSSIEFFGSARRLFFKLQDAQLDRESGLAALEKLKSDALQAGQGLIFPIQLGLTEGIGIEDATLILKNAAETGVLAEDARAGQTVIQVENAEDFAAGRTIYLTGSSEGESRAIATVGGGSLTLTSPLAHDYAKGTGAVALVQTISYYLDSEQHVLRRKVNSSSGQPVLEGVQSFSAGRTENGRLVTAELRLLSRPDLSFEIALLPKNLALIKRS